MQGLVLELLQFSYAYVCYIDEESNVNVTKLVELVKLLKTV